MRIRVCYIINSYPPRIGGAERLVETLSNELSKAGHRAIVITRKVKGTRWIDNAGNVTVIRVPAFGTRTMKSLLFRVFASLLLILLRKNYDLVHAHSLDSPASIASSVAPLLGKDYFVTIHNTGKVKELIKRPGGERRFRKIMQSCRSIVSINKDITYELLAAGFPEERITFLPNGVDTNRFSPAGREEKDRIMKALSIFGRTIYLFVGNFHSQKGIDTLIKAWSLFQSEVDRQTIALLMIGDGVLMEETRNLIKQLGLEDTVHLLGRKLNTHKYYKIADCFVQPSRWEGLSIALLEALASGCTVIATPVGGAKEIITDGENGFLTPVDDPRALADRLKLVYGDPEMRASIGREARKTVLENYSIANCTSRHIALYTGNTKKEKENVESYKENHSPAVERNEQVAGEDVKRVPQLVP